MCPSRSSSYEAAASMPSVPPQCMSSTRGSGRAMSTTGACSRWPSRPAACPSRCGAACCCLAAARRCACGGSTTCSKTAASSSMVSWKPLPLLSGGSGTTGAGPTGRGTGGGGGGGGCCCSLAAGLGGCRAGLRLLLGCAAHVTGAAGRRETAAAGRIARRGQGRLQAQQHAQEITVAM